MRSASRTIGRSQSLSSTPTKAAAMGLLVIGVGLAIVLLVIVGLSVLSAALIRHLENHGRDGL